MNKEIIGSAFFGYSKTSVCEYIASMNEEFSRQLMELENENKKEKAELKARINTLEKELNEKKKSHGEIADALLDAQQYAAIIKQKAEAENKKLIAENQKLQKEQSERLELYKAAIDKLRKELAVFSADTDKKLLEYCGQAEDIEKEFEEV